MKRTTSKNRHATRKSPEQLDREITEALLAGRPKPKPMSRAHKHALFYLSEDQQGGRHAEHAEHIERFDNLPAALDMLARLPEGSITYGKAAHTSRNFGPSAAPAHSELLYWTDGDLNVLNLIRQETREIRKSQTKRYGDLDKRFRQALKK